MKGLAILWGVLLCLLGVSAIAMPFRTFLGFGWLAAVLFIIFGIELIISAVKKEKKDILGCVLGVLAVLFGIWMTFSVMLRGMTDLLLAYYVGFNLILFSIYRFVAAYRLFKEKQKGNGTLVLICAILTLIAGVFSVIHPLITMFSVGWIIGISLIVYGITVIIAACSVK